MPRLDSRAQPPVMPNQRHPLALLLATSLLLATALLSPPLGADPPERLTFAWPDGAEAEVTYEINGWRRHGKSTTSIKRMQKYRLKVRRLEEGYEIERIWPTPMAWPKTSIFGGKPLARSGELQKWIDDLPEKVTQLRVSLEGQLESIGGAEAILEAVDQVLQRSGQSPHQRKAVRNLFRPEALFEISHQSWSALVTIWHGRLLKQDIPFLDTSDAAVPGREQWVEVAGEGRFRGPVPCTAEHREATCVKLFWSAQPDPEDTRDAIEALVGDGVLEQIVSRDITLVVNPGTLLPYSTRDRLAAKGKIRGPAGLVETEEEMVRTRHFRWLSPP